jgi:hypothetical protein
MVHRGANRSLKSAIFVDGLRPSTPIVDDAEGVG